MGWMIRVGKVGKTGFGRGRNADVITYPNCWITSDSCHTVAQLSLFPNAGKTTSGKAGSNPARQADKIWLNVLSILAGV